MGGTAHVGPGLLLSPSLGPLCAQILLFFVRPKYARAVLRADASVRCARCDEPHAVHRQEPPRAASSSTIPEPVRALARLARPPANAYRFCLVAFPIMWARCVGVAGTGDAAGEPRRTNMVVGLDSYVLGTRVRLRGSADRS